MVVIDALVGGTGLSSHWASSRSYGVAVVRTGP